MPWKEKDIVELKMEFVLKAMNPNIKLSDLCQHYGISRPTGYKWKRRFMEEGFQGLAERSRKPKNSPNQTSEVVVCEIIKLKMAHINWGPKKIQKLYIRNHPYEEIPSVSTIHRVLENSGLINHRKRRKQTKGQRLQKRIETKNPNDIWTVDFKGWWYTQMGDKCEPLTVRDLYSKYLFTVKAMQTSKTEHVKREFDKIFSIYGLPKVIRSDNGPPFACTRGLLGLTKLSSWWISLGIELDRITPGTPSENGSHERMHRDIKKELQGKITGGLKQHQASFDMWREEYNCVRPHEALDMQTPESVYTKSAIKYEPDNEEILYPLGYLSRKVNKRGIISINSQPIFISCALHGYHLGIKENPDETMSVWFDNLRLGSIDLKTMKFDRVDLREVI